MTNPVSCNSASTVGRLLTDLLLHESAYRRMWTRRIERVTNDGALNQAAVTRIVTEYVWQAGEMAEETSPRSVRHRVRRAVQGEGCSTTTLHWIIAAFDMSQEHANDLFRALAGDSPLPDGTVNGHFKALSPEQHRTRSLSEFHVIGPNKMPQRHRTIQVIEALIDGFQTYPYRFDTPAARVTVEDGGTPSPVVPMGEGLWGVWITLSRPLRKGETRSLVYETRYDYEVMPAPEFRRGARSVVTGVNLRVRFHPLALPSSVHWTTWTEEDDLETDEPVELDAEQSAERFLTLTPGTLVGYRWTW